MKAVGYRRPLIIDDIHALEDISLAEPELHDHDIRVDVQAVSVNPIDTKLRMRPLNTPDYRVLGFDAAGIVNAVGPEVRGFKVGDRVWYAGDIRRQGSNAQQQCVDARLVAHKPSSLGMQEAAALPLTALTAWQAIEDQMGFVPGADNRANTLLIIGGAGGVGAIATQLAAHYFGLTVIATAGNGRSATWCQAMGAHHVVNYRHDLVKQVRALGVEHVSGILNTQDLNDYWSPMCELIAPLGALCALVDARGPLDLNPLKPKSARFSWEFMFSRALHDHHPERQGERLSALATLVDQGTVQSTISESLGPICADNLKHAHRCIEQGHTIGKLVLAGW